MSRAGAVGLILATVLGAGALLLILELDYDVIPYISLQDRVAMLREGLIAFLALIIVWIVLHAVGRSFERVTAARVGSHAQARSIWKLMSYVIWGIVLLFLGLGLVGDVASAALSVGLVGAALALVLQRPLLNMFGWMSITYHRLYRIGDRVAVGDVRGYVTDVRLMYTDLREFGGWMHGDTFSGRIVTVPNGVVFESPVINYTRDNPFVWDEVESMVTYESDIDAAKNHMLDATRDVVGALMTSNYEKYRERLEIRDIEPLLPREPEIRMEFTDSGVKLYAIYFCAAERRRRTRSEIQEKIWRRYQADPRVRVAYPHREVVPFLGKSGPRWGAHPEEP
jgi:small-conductance mechanosensitive channel